LPSALLEALGKEFFLKKIRFLFAEHCLVGARQRNFQKKKILLFAERRVKTLDKEGVTVHNGHARRFSLPKAFLALGKGFAERPIKDARQRSLCRAFLCRDLFAEHHVRQRLCRAQIALCRASQALGKGAVCSSATPMTWRLPHVSFKFLPA